MIEALNIQVKGIVQGVGFRPFVYRMAKKYLINGWVLNATDGVHIHAEGESKLLDEFVLELSDNAPAAAQVSEITLAEVPLEDFTSFEIRFSDAAEVKQTTLVSPELATCDDCVRELFNPNDRRFRYPFINCTNCGPRFTIIEGLPYDRAKTSMRAFEMCDRCAAEYADPLDRRFHAQPDACFDCGPVVTWWEKNAEAPAQNVSRETFVSSATMSSGSSSASSGFGRADVSSRHSISADEHANASPRHPKQSEWREADGSGGDENVSRETSVRCFSHEATLERGVVYRGSTREESDAIFARAVEMLRAGKILAVKGLGGYHLVCDANNAVAVAELRRRKRREGKAFAVMMASADDVRAVCEVSAEEEAVLAGAQRPIVLLRKRADATFAPGLADGLSELGVMLPYTPVQHLLMHDFAASWLQNVSRETYGATEPCSDVVEPYSSTAESCDGAAEVRSGVAEFCGGATETRSDATGSRSDVAETRSGMTGSCSDATELCSGADDSSCKTACGTSRVVMTPMLVMTSGNLHDEPIVTSDEEAYAKLADVADAFLGNNRDILTRFDDSVVRVIRAGSAGCAVQFIRRARGYAPMPIMLTLPKRADASALFATGPEQKNTFALLRASAEADEARASASTEDSAGAAVHNVTESPYRAGDEAEDSSYIGAAAQDAAAHGAATHGAAARNAADDAVDSSASGAVSVEAFVSQHIGDMENAETYDAWLEAARRFERLFEVEPAAVACDKHPEYLSSKWAHEQALPVTEVQHHHAHVASVVAEHGLSGAVCGIAFDGTGYGVDGAIWGGEVLLANLQAFERFANFAYVPMPGGAAAIKHPLRMAYGVLWAYDLLEHPAAARLIEKLGAQAGICEAMIEQGINTPSTSSVGRLFDAASALLGVCEEPGYEGEGACLLEAAISSPAANAFPAHASSADAHVVDAGDPTSATGVPAGVHAAAPASAPAASPDLAPAHASAPTSDAAASDLEDAARERYAIAITKNTATDASTAQDTSVLLLDAGPTFRALLDDLAAGVSSGVIARRFHDAFVGAVVQAAELVRALYGISTVALSGGVFMNRYLVEHALDELERAGFTAAINRELPPNDGCISLGQAVVAWAQRGE